MIYRKLYFVLAAGLFSTAIAYAEEQTPPSMMETVTAPQSSSDMPVSRAALPQLKLEELSATRERPLFALDRRPVAPPAQVVNIPAGPQKKQMPLLRGIIVSSLSTIVLLQDAATSDSIIINSGDTFGPWKVVAESDHSVSLTEGNEKISLDLFEP